MAEFTKINIPYSRDNNTLAQPSSIIGPDGSELKQVKDEEGNIIWGKYPLLIEDDYGTAFNFWDVMESPDTYTKWDSNFASKLKSLTIDIRPINNRVHNMPLTDTILELEAPEKGNAEKWKDQNIYHYYCVGLSLETSDGCYLNSNKTDTSWGASTKINPYWWTSSSLGSFFATDGSPVLYADLNQTQYGYVLPKYGQFNFSTSTSAGGSGVETGYPKRTFSFNTKHPSILGYAYSGNNISNVINSGDPVYFGDQVTIKAICQVNEEQGDFMYPENNKEYTFTLDGTAAEGETQAKYLDTPEAAAEDKFAQIVPLDFHFDYPLYFEGNPYWYAERSASTSGSSASLGPILGYSLKDANLIVNPFCLSPTGALNKPIRLTLHCDKGRFMAGSYNTDNIHNYIPFIMRPSGTVGGGTGTSGVKIDSSGSHLTSSFNLTVANNNIFKKSALEYPWKEYAKGRQIQVNRPLFYYTNISNSTKSSNASKPTVCHITYTYNDKLYVADYTLSTPAVKPVEMTMTVDSSNAELIWHRTYADSDNGILANNITLQLPAFTFQAPLNQTCDAINYSVSVDFLDSNNSTLASGTSKTGTLNNISSNLKLGQTVGLYFQNTLVKPQDLPEVLDQDNEDLTFDFLEQESGELRLGFNITIDVIVDGYTFTHTYGWSSRLYCTYSYDTNM